MTEFDGEWWMEPPTDGFHCRRVLASLLLTSRDFSCALCSVGSSYSRGWKLEMYIHSDAQLWHTFECIISGFTSPEHTLQFCSYYVCELVGWGSQMIKKSVVVLMKNYRLAVKNKKLTAIFFYFHIIALTFVLIQVHFGKSLYISYK